MTWVNDPNPALLVLIVAMLAPVATVIVGYWEPRRVSVIAVASAATAFLAALWGAMQDPSSWDAPWIETWNVHLAIRLDGLAAMYAWRSVYWSEQVSMRTRALLMIDWVVRCVLFVSFSWRCCSRFLWRGRGIWGRDLSRL